MYDVDNSGLIDRTEFFHALQHLGVQLTWEDAQAVFSIVDQVQIKIQNNSSLQFWCSTSHIPPPLQDSDNSVTMSEFVQHYIANY